MMMGGKEMQSAVEGRVAARRGQFVSAALFLGEVLYKIVAILFAYSILVFILRRSVGLALPNPLDLLLPLWYARHGG